MERTEARSQSDPQEGRRHKNRRRPQKKPQHSLTKPCTMLLKQKVFEGREEPPPCWGSNWGQVAPSTWSLFPPASSSISLLLCWAKKRMQENMSPKRTPYTLKDRELTASVSVESPNACSQSTVNGEERHSSDLPSARPSFFAETRDKLAVFCSREHN